MFRKLAAALAALVASTAVLAQDYPNRTISIVVPFAAGGPTDTVTRLVAQSMSKTLGQSVIVENVAGAGGTIGPKKVAASKPDGYTLVLMHIGISTSVTLYRNLGYNPQTDLAPIGLVTDVPMTFIARKDFPPKDMKELIAYVKANKDKVTYANAGVGAASHLCGMLLMTAIQTDLTTVPYKGTGPAMTDLIGGQVTSMFTDVLVAMPFIQSGRVRPFAVTSLKRHPMLPDVPTVAESGYPGFEALSWQGLFVPKGTPRAIVGKLNAQTRKALASPEIKDFFSAQGMEVQATSPEEFRAFVEKEIPKWARIIKEANVTLQ